MSHVLYIFIYFIKFKSGKSVCDQNMMNLHPGKAIICVYLQPGKLMCHHGLGGIAAL